MDLHRMDKKKLNNKFHRPKGRRQEGQQPQQLEKEESVDLHSKDKKMDSNLDKKKMSKKGHRHRGHHQVGQQHQPHHEENEESEEEEEEEDDSEELHPGAFREGGMNSNPDLEDEFTTTFPTTSTIQPPPSTLDEEYEALAAEVVPGKEEIIQQRIQDRTVDALKVVQDTHSTTPSQRSSEKKTFIFLVGLLLLGIAMAVVLPYKDNNNEVFAYNGNPPPPLDSAVDGPTTPPTVSKVEIESALALLTPISGKETLLDDSTPQYKAFMWLVHEDNNVFTQDNTTLLEDDDISRLFIIERYVMAVLYFATGGPDYWFVKCNFLNITTSVCDWNLGRLGAKCDERGQVTTLVFDRNNLNGTVPSELSVLTNLATLSFAISDLYGPLPPSLGDLVNLKLFQVLGSQVSGSIPESFTKLRKLQSLYLPYNLLTGSIPQELFVQLSSLELVALSENYISGVIPEFAENHEMRLLNLHNNMLTGSIPESIHSPTLDTFVLSENQLSGTISTRVGRLVDMRAFFVGANNMTGTLPTELGMISNLLVLHLNDNNFFGTVPTELGQLKRLYELNFAHNNLSGTVPKEMADLSADVIFLQSNNLTGPLDMFCAREALLTRVDADCGGINPLVDCPCCVSCCGKNVLGDEECALSFQNNCKIDQLSFEDEHGMFYQEAAGTECKCSSAAMSNITLSCRDADCQMCNLDGTVCAINQMYYFGYDDIGIRDYFNATFQYVVGRNDTVTFESFYSLSEYECHVTVNGELCNSCGAVSCLDGFTGFEVECDNLNGAGRVGVCNEKGEEDHGPLAVFAFQDPMRREGCPPRFFPMIGV